MRPAARGIPHPRCEESRSPSGFCRSRRDWINRRFAGAAARRGIADRVTWTGMLTGDTKWGALRAAEVFALTSHQENFGIAVVEALACGTAVLISRQVNI